MLFAAGRGPEITKDPNIQRLRQSVADQLWDIIKDEETSAPDPNAVQFVSFEDALRELTNAKKLD